MATQQRSEEVWNHISYVSSSHYRVKVLKKLRDGPNTPSQIAEHYDLEIAHISRALKNLRTGGYIELLVSEETKKGRFYGLTERGKETIETILDMDLNNVSETGETGDTQ